MQDCGAIAWAPAVPMQAATGRLQERGLQQGLFHHG
jgi:hypothetical protein